MFLLCIHKNISENDSNIYVFIRLHHQSECLDQDFPIRHRLGLPKLHRLKSSTISAVTL